MRRPKTREGEGGKVARFSLHAAGTAFAGNRLGRPPVSLIMSGRHDGIQVATQAGAIP